MRRAPPDNPVRRRQPGAVRCYPEPRDAAPGAVPTVDDLGEQQPAQLGENAEQRVHDKRDRHPQRADGHRRRAQETPAPTVGRAEHGAVHHAGGDGDREPGAADENGHRHSREYRGAGRAQPPARGQHRSRDRRGDRQHPTERKEARGQADSDHQVDEDGRFDDFRRAQVTPGREHTGCLRPPGETGPAGEAGEAGEAGGCGAGGGHVGRHGRRQSPALVMTGLVGKPATTGNALAGPDRGRFVFGSRFRRVTYHSPSPPHRTSNCRMAAAHCPSCLRRSHHGHRRLLRAPEDRPVRLAAPRVPAGRVVVGRRPVPGCLPPPPRDARTQSRSLIHTPIAGRSKPAH